MFSLIEYLQPILFFIDLFTRVLFTLLLMPLFKNISFISRQSVLLVEETGVLKENNRRHHTSLTNLYNIKLYRM